MQHHLANKNEIDGKGNWPLNNLTVHACVPVSYLVHTTQVSSLSLQGMW